MKKSLITRERVLRTKKFPTTSVQLKCARLLRPSFCHCSMKRRSTHSGQTSSCFTNNYRKVQSVLLHNIIIIIINSSSGSIISISISNCCYCFFFGSNISRTCMFIKMSSSFGWRLTVYLLKFPMLFALSLPTPALQWSGQF